MSTVDKALEQEEPKGKGAGQIKPTLANCLNLDDIERAAE
jgi:hypothetical protein